MTLPTTATTLQDLQLAHVLKVYTGRARGCMCGCKGQYRYNSAFVEEGGRDRGYPLDPEDVNDAQVLKVLRTVQANEEALVDEGDGILSVDLGRRTFVLYLVQVRR
jgi:hypothetical protein